MDAGDCRAGAGPKQPRRLGAVAALAAGAAMVVLSLTGLSGVDRRLEAAVRDADRVSAPQLRPAYRGTDDGRCERDERPAAVQRRL